MDSQDITILVIDENIGQQSSQHGCLRENVKKLHELGFRVLYYRHFNGHDIKPDLVIVNGFDANYANELRCYHAKYPYTKCALYGGQTVENGHGPINQPDGMDLNSIRVPMFSRMKYFTDWVKRETTEKQSKHSLTGQLYD